MIAAANGCGFTNKQRRPVVLGKRPIRAKLLVGLSLLVLVVVTLAGSGLVAIYSYRNLVNSLSWRVSELPVAAELSRHVADLRITLSELRGLQLRGLQTDTFNESHSDQVSVRVLMCRNQFRQQLNEVKESFSKYRNQLENEQQTDSLMAHIQSERDTAGEIEKALSKVIEANRDENWMFDDRVGWLDVELEKLQNLAASLPSHLHSKLGGFADEVRSQYRMLINGTWTVTIMALLLFAVFMRLFYRWIFLPLRVLVAGSRRVAGGDFDYRIYLATNDEMSELAEAMNGMTARFQAIRDDLDRQVQERTRQVVRAEQMASVGLLAAGVAHEINNPLASIALCAESLEGRISGALTPDNEQHAVVTNYLRMIQTEAFRCKEITEKLLDFSRIGPVKRQNADLGELIQGVIDMVGHIGKYQRKHIEFIHRDTVVAFVSAQEIKQVVLNLLTNALDSLDDDGKVRIELATVHDYAEIAVIDNGCGMEAGVLRHIFEPFFTRRRGGQGTGLGLSISYRIVSDHGGRIEGSSRGAGQGATFRVWLPIRQSQQELHKETDHRRQAA
jgi:two-component system, NtrC family, sensor kinase